MPIKKALPKYNAFKRDDIINFRIKVQSAIFELLEKMGKITPETREAVQVLALDILNNSLTDRIHSTMLDNTITIDHDREKKAQTIIDNLLYSPIYDWERIKDIVNIEIEHTGQ